MTAYPVTQHRNPFHARCCTFSSRVLGEAREKCRKASGVKSRRCRVSMGIRAVESYNAEFTLPPEVQDALYKFLKRMLEVQDRNLKYTGFTKMQSGSESLTDQF